MIADVSGKGITAAMFMAVTLMLIRQYAKMGLSPAEILQRTNDTLSENNAELLFAAAFLGIFDSAEKSFTYANAGHNLPYLIGKTPRTRCAEYARTAARRRCTRDGQGKRSYPRSAART